jgi:aspartyl-tRNA(Asn)/glutamyl-tRNA(Gln) amidotransferase subunit C
VLADVVLRLRDDVASEPDQREANQRSAPAVERGLFLVPKVIE